jgi:hypothetical protein
MSEMHKILNKLQQLNESTDITEAEKKCKSCGKPISKCKCDDHDHKKEMKESVEARLLKEYAEFKEAKLKEEQADEVMPFVKMTYKEIQDDIKSTRLEMELGDEEDVAMLEPRLRDLLDMKDVVKVILNNKGWDTGYIVGAMMDSGLDTSVREELAEKFKKQVSKDPQLAKKLFKEEPKEGNEFSGELAKAKAAGAKSFKVGDKEYKVTEMFSKQDKVGTKKKTTHGTAEKTATGLKHTRDYKPDYLDLDKDGDKEEPMKKAAKDKKEKKA